MARALSQVGGFAPADVIVLREPEPTEILTALDRELGRLRARPGESLLFFYFSGHADHEAVYSRGRPLLLRALRDRLDDPAATVRIGFIDACRGGGWTRAKGLTRSAALWKHAVPNALIPVVTIIGLQFSFLLAGTIIIENVFNLPGVGRLVFQAIAQRDLVTVQSLVTLLAASVIAVNFMVDLIYGYLDPRLSTGVQR